MIIVILVILGVMIIAAAIMALYSKDILGAIIAAGVASLLASIIYLIAGSPDVAMTEAAIGSGLTTVVFLFAWSRIKKLMKKDAIPEKDSGTAGGVSVDPNENKKEELVEKSQKGGTDA